MNISYWRYPFLYLSGSDFKTLSKCSSDVITRYSLLGALVCIPAIIGFCSCYYAVSLVFKSPSYTIAIALIWGITILTIDRCIVAYNPDISTDGSKNSHYSLTAARVGLSLVLGFVVAEPMCIGIFQDEIQEQIDNDKRLAAEDNIKLVQSRIREIEQSIEERRNEWLQFDREATGEADGSLGSKKRNVGPIYEIKKAKADNMKSSFDEFASASQVEIDSLKGVRSKIVNDTYKNKAIGLLGQINALGKVASKNMDLWVSIWVLRLFFVCIELMPLILKSSLKRSEDSYVVICNDNNKISINLNREEKHNLTTKEMKFASADEDALLAKVLNNKNIRRAAQDFEFFNNTIEYSTRVHENGKREIEKMVEDDVLRTKMISTLIDAFKNFVSKTEYIYEQSTYINDGDKVEDEIA